MYIYGYISIFGSAYKELIAFNCFALLTFAYPSLPLSLFLQASMDLPPDKAKLLRNYDDEKKWDMICDQVSEII